MTVIPVAIGLSGVQVSQLLASAELQLKLARAPAVFTVLGVDRVSPVAGAPMDTTRPTVRLDPAIVASWLASSLPESAWVIPAAAQRDHPYNLARRVQSLDLLTHGRSGILLGATDQGVPAGSPWATRAAGSRLRAADAAVLLAKLAQSWPADSIVADAARDVFVESQRIKAVDHDGVFRSAGPLSAPTSPQIAPVLLWFAADAAAARDAPAPADGIVLPTTVGHGEVAQVRRSDESVRLLATVDAANVEDQEIERLTEAGADLLLLTDPSSHAGELLDVVAARFSGNPGPVRGTLRSRLGMAAPPELLGDARPAFATSSGLAR